MDIDLENNKNLSENLSSLQIQEEPILRAQPSSTLEMQDIRLSSKPNRAGQYRPPPRTCDLKEVRQEVKVRRQRSYERDSDGYGFFTMQGGYTEEELKDAEYNPNFNIRWALKQQFRSDFWQEQNYRYNKKVKREVHAPNKGYSHHFINILDEENDMKTPNLRCLICKESYNRHFESILGYGSGYLNRHYQLTMLKGTKPKRTHSFHEYEKYPMRELCAEEMSLKYRLQQAHKELFAQDKKTFYCEICYSDCEIQSIAILQRCGHYFCKTCLQDYYNYMVNESGEIQRIKCPNTDCKAEIEYSDLRNLLNSDTYQKFKRLLLNYEVTKSKDKKFCPYPGCEAVIQRQNQDQKRITCQNCHKDVCFECQIPWHQGQSCKQAMNKIYSGWAASFGAHQCPKCHIPIEKDHGCNHMSCPKCNHHWCWTCGLPVNHWVHTFTENPFGCKFSPINGKAMIWKTLVFIAGFIFIPLALTILPVLAGFCYGVYGGCALSGYLCCGRFSVDGFWTFIFKVLMIIIAIPVFFIAVGLLTALGALGGGLGAIVSVPALMIHCYMFGRSIYWWNKNRNHS